MLNRGGGEDERWVGMYGGMSGVETYNSLIVEWETLQGAGYDVGMMWVWEWWWCIMHYFQVV